MNLIELDKRLEEYSGELKRIDCHKVNRGKLEKGFIGALELLEDLFQSGICPIRNVYTWRFI